MIKNSFNEVIKKLQDFWKKKGCTIIQPIDLEVGAATFHPNTFFYAINSKPWMAAYTQISRRPSDKHYNINSNRLTMFHQFQVIIKPSLKNIQKLYLESLEKLGIDIKNNDIKFIEDNWESPTLGASGIGWEVWLNGIEITQFTYFQQMGGIDCFPIMVELAYGLERITMYLQNTFKIKDIIFDNNNNNVKYSDLYSQYEEESSKYISEEANTKLFMEIFYNLEKECEKTINKNLPSVAYEMIIKMSHIFNILDSKSCLSNIERQNFVLKIRSLSNNIAKKIKNG